MLIARCFFQDAVVFWLLVIAARKVFQVDVMGAKVPEDQVSMAAASRDESRKAGGTHLMLLRVAIATTIANRAFILV